MKYTRNTWLSTMGDYANDLGEYWRTRSIEDSSDFALIAIKLRKISFVYSIASKLTRTFFCNFSVARKSSAEAGIVRYR